MMWTFIAVLAVQSATPSPEAVALGRRLAETGTLATLLPLISEKETEELVAGHNELNDADRAELRAIAQAQAASGIEKLLAAEGSAYAAALSVDDLKALVAFGESGAAKRHRAALPGIIATTVQTAEKVDFKREALAAFCAKPGRVCPAP